MAKPRRGAFEWIASDTSDSTFTRTRSWLLLKSLPVPDPGRLVRYSASSNDGNNALAYRLYQALRGHPGPTQGLFAWDDSIAELNEGASARQVPVGLATGSVFRCWSCGPIWGGWELTAARRNSRSRRGELPLTHGSWLAIPDRGPATGHPTSSCSAQGHTTRVRAG